MDIHATFRRAVRCFAFKLPPVHFMPVVDSIDVLPFSLLFLENDAGLEGGVSHRRWGSQKFGWEGGWV